MGVMGLKIVIEKNIPFIRGVLDGMAEVTYLSPSEITRDALMDADALITRTRTRCDEALLHGTRCRFIASATIGLDHVDLDYCRKAGITVANAPGCNAPAVAQYVLASLLTVWKGDLAGKTLGIVGVGHVGSIVDDWARQLGMRTLLCDPPRAEAEGAEGFCGLDDIALEADAVTFHTPFTRSGQPYATQHLCDARFLSLLKRRPVIINSARGPIADNAALLQSLRDGQISAAVIDCWEGEPDIDAGLLEAAAVATPHIAGYSREGKVRATRMAVSALCRHFGLAEPPMDELSVPQGAARHVTADAIRASYNPLDDTRRLKEHPGCFEDLRNNYDLRAEVANV